MSYDYYITIRYVNDSDSDVTNSLNIFCYYATFNCLQRTLGGLV